VTAPAEPTERKHDVLATVLFAVLFIVLLVGVGWLFFGFLTDFVFALLFVSMFQPAYRWILPRVKGKTWLASLLVCVLVIHAVFLPASLLIGTLSAEAADLYQTSRQSISLEKAEDFFFGSGVVATYALQISDAVGFEYTPEKVKEAITGVIGPVSAFLNHQIQTLLANVFSFLYHFAIMILILFYLLIDGSRLKKFLFELSPLPDDEEQLIVDQFMSVGRATLFGNGVASLLQGVLGGISMAICGLPSSVLWGSVMALLAFLPLVGISMVTIPAGIYLIATGHTVAAVVFIIFNAAQAVFVEKVVKVKLIGDQMKMHNLLIFLSIFGGLALFGIIGTLYGPLLVAFFLTFAELYHRHYKARLAHAIAR
jgi:predicted PurR-regulated permease PerM